jgi:hypothetical protein
VIPPLLVFLGLNTSFIGCLDQVGLQSHPGANVIKPFFLVGQNKLELFPPGKCNNELTHLLNR